MEIKPLKIGDLVAELPIIQGGMGVGISRSRLAAAVANEGGIGVISSAQIGYDEEDFNKNPLTANIRALKNHIIKAKKDAKKGIIGLNIMVALNNYEEYVKAAIEAGIDLIISGAGLPTGLPILVKNTKVKIAPIVSSLKACKTILKLWDRKYETTADLVVIEGPKAGGHLGFLLEDLENNNVELDQILVEVLEEVKQYESKYNKEIPVVVAGGIYTGTDIGKFMNLGASGVQMATRFIATYECDAHENYKQAFLNRTKDEIELVKSPVGMPGRAIVNKLVQTIKHEKVKVRKCYDCLKRDHCDRVNIPYCITNKLIEAAEGDVDNGLLFCGENAYRLKKIVSVKEIIDELKDEMLAY
ncbi:MAG: 2-nitropropane dioxygenase [Haloplasmataceae bacterium]|nr:2-nitropropane dioxygenase [Haloplasmataceae bacterium]